MFVNLKYFLLGLLLLMLVYILYKRLIAALSKGKGRRNFVQVQDVSVDQESGQVIVELELQSRILCKVDLLDSAMRLCSSHESELEEKSTLQLDTKPDCKAAWVRITTEFETIERRVA